MPDSLREQIFDAISTRLSGILIAGGYNTDIGLRAYKWRVTPFAETELPAHSISDPEDTIETKVSRIHDHTLTVEVVALDKKPAAVSVDQHGRKMLADIWKAIGVDRTFGGLAFDSLPVADELVVEHSDNLRVGAKVKFNVRFRTLMFDPYTQA